MRYTMKQNKYTYSKVLQCRTEQGWEDLCEYPVNDTKECRADVKAYRTNQGEYEYRVIKRRVLCEK